LTFLASQPCLAFVSLVDIVTLLAGVALALFALLVLSIFMWLVYFLLTLPLRRRERVRVFLSIMETAMRQGRSVEHAIVFLAHAHERCIGAWPSWLARCLDSGDTLIEALAANRGLLPPQIAEMLAVGDRIGDIQKVLPACKRMQKDAASRVKGTINYFILLVVGLGFAQLLLVLPIIGRYILPQFERMFSEMGTALPLEWAILTGPMFTWAPITLFVLVLLAVGFYIGGPSLVELLHIRRPCGLLFFVVPWRRKRLQRDFSAMLAILLDAGVPEEEAVTLAARSTANWVFIERGKKVVAALRRGVALTDAIKYVDRSGEFKWRLRNAVHAQSGFLQALAGWNEALDAKAYQQEQAAAHVISTAFVVTIGSMVGLVGFAIFHVFVSLTDRMMLW